MSRSLPHVAASPAGERSPAHEGSRLRWRSWLLLFCVAAQLAVLLFMMGSREIVVARGDTLYLRTAPIDPRDPFRGDFVRLNYRFNDLLQMPVKWQPDDLVLKQDDRVYLVLESGAQDVYEPAYITNQKPAAGRFIRGRLNRPESNTDAGIEVGVRFGIEQMFVEQGSGLELEQRRGTRNDWQTAMEAQIAVGRNGLAVLRGYRWSPISTRTDLTHFQLTNPTQSDAINAADSTATSDNSNTDSVTGSVTGSVTAADDTSSHLVWSLKNSSDLAVTLFDPGHPCAVRLQRVAVRQHWLDTDTSFNRFCNAAMVAFTAAEPTGKETETEMPTIVLEPGEVYTLNINFTDPRWHIGLPSRLIDAQLQPATSGDLRVLLQPWQTFEFDSDDNDNQAAAESDARSEQSLRRQRPLLRLVYRAPRTGSSGTDTTANAKTGSVWQGVVYSPAFGPQGVVD